VAAAYFETNADVLKEADARVIEGSELSAIDVGTAESSAFDAFLDGIQRADVRLYHGSVPIVYAYGAAVIRERDDRRMRTMCLQGAELMVEREALFFPSEYVPRAHLHDIGLADEQLIDTTPAGSEPLPLFPPLLHARAAMHVNRWRESLERGLAARWCARPNGWLLVDGSLTVSPEVSACESAVGLIKSHRTRFFDGDEARVMLGLKPGQRTSVFEPATRSFTPVRSWYLRLRGAERRDVFWAWSGWRSRARMIQPSRIRSAGGCSLKRRHSRCPTEGGTVCFIQFTTVRRSCGRGRLCCETCQFNFNFKIQIQFQLQFQLQIRNSNLEF
jgi:hypothetical protein